MQLSPLSQWLFYLSLTISLLCVVKRRKHRSSNNGANLPPGPTPLPIVGSLFELGNMPHRSLARLANTYGPVMALKLGRIATVIISSPDAARDALQKRDNFLSSRSVPDAVRVLGHHNVSVIWTPPSQPWKHLRTVLRTHIFSQQRLDAHQHLRKMKVQELVAHVRRRAGSRVRIGQAAFDTALNLISTTCFSVNLVDLDSDSAQEFKGLVWGIMEEVGSPNLSDFFPMLAFVDPNGRRRRFMAHLKKLFQVFDEMIDCRLQAMEVKGDFLDELLKLHLQDDEFKLDRLSLKSLLADTFVAGSDPSSNTVEWAMAELLRHPSIMAKARAELAEVIGRGSEVTESDISQLPFLQAIVKEAFRLHPPAPLLLPRKAEADVDISGYTVPKQAKVLVNVWAMGRDAGLWEDPEAFRPERFVGSDVDFRGRFFELIPFGSGRRMCPGLPLAHRMVHLMLASLVHWFEWRLPDGMRPEDLDLGEKFGVNLALVVPLEAVPEPVMD